MRDELADGWKISQVEALVGLPRRDIQRACYEGAGGLGIVHPQNTTWGWRMYETLDMAKLFLLAQARKKAHSVDDIRRDFAECDNLETLLARLSHCEQRGRDLCDVQAGVALSAHALGCALRHAPASAFAEMLDVAFAESVSREGSSRETLRLASESYFSRLLEQLASARAADAEPNSAVVQRVCYCAAHELGRALALGLPAACDMLYRVLNAPGVALACELWLGPATHSFANAAVENAITAVESCASCGRAEQ